MSAPCLSQSYKQSKPSPVLETTPAQYIPPGGNLLNTTKLWCNFQLRFKFSLKLVYARCTKHTGVCAFKIRALPISHFLSTNYYIRSVGRWRRFSPALKYVVFVPTLGGRVMKKNRFTLNAEQTCTRRQSQHLTVYSIFA